MFAEYRAGGNGSAESMTRLVERWQDTALGRSLRFHTPREACGRRGELALKKYAREDLNLGFRFRSLRDNRAYGYFGDVMECDAVCVRESDRGRGDRRRNGLSSVVENWKMQNRRCSSRDRSPSRGK